MIKVFKIFIILLIIYSCSQNKIFDKYIGFNEMTWYVDSTLIYKFKTYESNNNFSFSLKFRYKLNYPYQNLFYSYYLIDSTDTILSKQLQEIILFDEKSGKPTGSGISSIFNIEKLIVKNIRLKNNNSYQFHVNKLMREDHIKGINAVGLMIKKNN